MRSIRTHAAAAVTIMAMLAVLFCLLLIPGMRPSPRATSAVPEVTFPEPTGPAHADSRIVYEIEFCSFMIAAAEPDAPANPRVSVDCPPATARSLMSPPAAPSIPTAAVQNELIIHFEIELSSFQKPPLASDWNGDDAVTLDDLWAFLNGWFAGAGDANKDGQTRTDDLFTFLNNWFDGR